MLSVRDETPTARTYRLALPEPRRHLAGQHYVLRLTAPDGYTASRSYSVASAPDDTGEIELTVERLVGGEVSEFLHDVVVAGDELEVRGPIGLFFVWPGDRPALLVGGGSGVVPLMAMLRQARRDGRADLLRVLVSARSPDDLYYADELPGDGVRIVWTRAAPPGDPRGAGPDDRRRPGAAGARRAGRLRLRIARVRRRGHRPAAGGGRAGRGDPRGAVRPFGLSPVTHR